MNGQLYRAAAFGPMAAAAHSHGAKFPGLPHHAPAYHGTFCKSCCHPASKCCCHRECMKEPKELLVTPTVKKPVDDKGKINLNLIKTRMTSFFTAEHISAAADTAQPLNINAAATGIAAGLDAGNLAAGTDNAIIGGGCCVHLSIEYMQDIEIVPAPAGTLSAVVVYVIDSDNTMLVWGKGNVPAGYHIKEGIITTNPGAKLSVIVMNAIARVRWCEVFSC